MVANTKYLDKTDVFPLYINCVPYIGNYIRSRIFHASIVSKILYVARTTSGVVNVITCVNLLLIWM